MDGKADVLDDLEQNSAQRPEHHIGEATFAGFTAETQHLRQLLDVERASHQATRMQLKKRSRTERENEERATELHQLSHYLNAKIISLEKTVKRISDDEDVKVVFLNHHDKLEALQRK